MPAKARFENAGLNGHYNHSSSYRDMPTAAQQEQLQRLCSAKLGLDTRQGLSGYFQGSVFRLMRLHYNAVYT